MEIRDLGLLPYVEALDVMESLHKEIQDNPQREGVVLVLEHPPTVTMGKRELLQDMLVPPDQLKYKGIAFHKIDRGGSVTVHEPGQVVVYPIFHIDTYKQSVRSYVNILEESMISIAAKFGVVAARDAINPGVWVGALKIGAVGIRISNKVTKHGIAFNVNNNLETFSNIIPCGLRGRGVTSLKVLLQSTSQHIDIELIKKSLAEEIKFKLLKN